jgi:hypothetical protein
MKVGIENALNALNGVMRTGMAFPLALAVTGLLVLMAPSAEAAAIRYASPDGSTESTSTCPPSDPCELQNALDNAQDGDEVVLLPGDYEKAGGGSFTVDHQVYVHGQPDQPPVRLFVTAGTSPVLIVNTEATIEGLLLEQTGGGEALFVDGPSANGSLIDRVVARSVNYYGCEIGDSDGVLLRNSACLSEADGYLALAIFNYFESGTVLLRNVTARSTGAPFSYGISAETASTQLVVDGRNVIADGSTADVNGDAQGMPPFSVTVNLTSSNYDSESELSGGQVTDPGTNGNQTATPLLAADGYHQLLSSPTINGGTADALIGALDVDGEPRSSGAAPDIGADEVQEAAAIAASPPKCKGKSATVFRANGRKLTGTNKRDVIVGTKKKDKISSRGGNDLVCAKGGNDKVNGGAGKDKLFGQGGKDKLKGAGGNDKLVGGAKKDTLVGGAGKDKLLGKGGNDTCVGGPGKDVERSC